MADERTRIVAGCMTGTSLDGIDVALVRITGTGLEMKTQLLRHHAESMPEQLRATLMSLASGEAREPIVYMRAARALGAFHAQVLEQLLAGGLVPPIEQPVDFITAHGQTIWHAPGSRAGEREDGHAGMSWQLFDPWPIVRRLKRPVCYDLRQADLIAGGEGAPLTPIADWVMYREQAEIVINLGGVCNATWFSGTGIEGIRGFDLVACNLLLNSLSEQLLRQPYDRDGQAALSGRPRKAVCAAIEKYALPVGGAGKSLGRESFVDGWIEKVMASDPHAAHTDILASAVEVICRMVGLFVIGIDEVNLSLVLAGGGVRNMALVRGLREEMQSLGTVALSDDLGIPCEAREAMAWAVLGAFSQDGVPVSLPQVTGAKDPGVAGVWAGL